MRPGRSLDEGGARMSASHNIPPPGPDGPCRDAGTGRCQNGSMPKPAIEGHSEAIRIDIRPEPPGWRIWYHFPDEVVPAPRPGLPSPGTVRNVLPGKELIRPEDVAEIATDQFGYKGWLEDAGYEVALDVSKQFPEYLGAWLVKSNIRPRTQTGDTHRRTQSAGSGGAP